MYQCIEKTLTDHVATVTINRPEWGNMLSRETYGEICDAIQTLEADDNVGAIVITGKGKHFSAGGDIVRFKGLIDRKEYLSVDGITYAGAMTKAIRFCKKPVIAMVNGVATGAGCSLALACDFRFVTKRTKLIMGFIKLGLSGDTGGIYFLQQLVGFSRALEMMMTGDPVTGEQAVAMGLANRLVLEEKLEEETYAFADKLAHGPLYAMERQKSLVNEIFFENFESYSKKETEYIVACSKTQDFAEAVNAYLEKREPNFVGK
jgi:2-(1,2-epoxy-1,2-dihydrophenyl)acetyl-CoA isomerase